MWNECFPLRKLLKVRWSAQYGRSNAVWLFISLIRWSHREVARAVGHV